MNKDKIISRRKLISYFSAIPLLAFFSPFSNKLFAMSRRPDFNGFHSVKGDVTHNSEKAKEGDLIKPGDKVTTGAKSKAIIVSNKSAFLIKANSEIEFPKPLSEEITDDIIREIKILSGKLLSVFGRGKRRITTSTAVIGVKGTGLYVETFNDMTYVCTCYGTVEIASKAQPKRVTTVTATHHDKPLFVNNEEKKDPFLKAKIMNHSDSELIKLEYLVGRQPPFYDPNNPDGDYY